MAIDRDTLYAVMNERLVTNVDILVRNGVISVNEARSLFNLGPFATDRVVEIGERCSK